MSRTVTLDVLPAASAALGAALEDIRIASPCPMDWDRMVGDDKRRFCEHCGLHVHNIAAMTLEETVDLLGEASRGGRVCARLYRRADGTILTRDCPVGLAAARARLARVAGRVAAVLALAITGAWVFGRDRDRSDRTLADVQPFAKIREWLAPVGLMPRPSVQTFTMGAVCTPGIQDRLADTLQEEQINEPEDSQLPGPQPLPREPEPDPKGIMLRPPAANQP